jgi:hypothetical protein
MGCTTKDDVQLANSSDPGSGLPAFALRPLPLGTTACASARCRHWRLRFVTSLSAWVNAFPMNLCGRNAPLFEAGRILACNSP